MFVALFGAAVTAAQTPVSVGPAFTKVLAVARLDADCVPLGGLPGCPSRPLATQLALDEAMATATWRIERPASYLAAFRSSLGKYLIEQRARRIADPSLAAVDYHRFQLALNVLPPYYSCLEGHVRAAADTAFASGSAINHLADEADAKCAEPKRVAFQSMGYKGPDFHGFDPLADADAPGSETAAMLKHIEEFAVSYNAALRGAPWRKAIATTVVPESTLMTGMGRKRTLLRAALDALPRSGSRPEESRNRNAKGKKI